MSRLTDAMLDLHINDARNGLAQQRRSTLPALAGRYLYRIKCDCFVGARAIFSGFQIPHLHVFDPFDADLLSNANEFGNRSDLHLPHHAGPMYLDGFFGRAKVARDLLVQAPC